MATCYLLGAGFSNHFASLPTMTGLYKRFQEIHDEYEGSSDPNHENRAFWGRSVLEFFDALEEQFVRAPWESTGERVIDSNFKEDIESIVSYIDLNISRPVRGQVEKAGVRADFDQSSRFAGRYDLQQIRIWIETYLYLALSGPYPELEAVLPFLAHLQAGDTVVTFNYDLLVETGLWYQRRWTPIDGYGFSFAEPPDFSEEASFDSEVLVYKLHGSLNWRPPSPFPREPLRLVSFYDDQSPIFEGCLRVETPPLDEEYVGGQSAAWMLPSFIKQFDAPEQLQSWQGAMIALRSADRVVFGGYSLPSADAAATILLTCSDLSQKEGIIVDHNASTLVERYSLVAGINDFETYHDFDEYLAHDTDTA